MTHEHAHALALARLGPSAWTEETRRIEAGQLVRWCVVGVRTSEHEQAIAGAGGTWIAALAATDPAGGRLPTRRGGR